MTDLDKNLLNDERILFRTKKHKIIFLYPVMVTFLLFFLVNYMQSNIFLRNNIFLAQVVWIPWFIILIFWSYIGLEYWTSEFAVTNKRVMMREGFFFKHMNETRLATISQVNVNQSLLGRLLNYGIVSINAFGAYDAFANIAKPLVFQKYVNEQLDQLVR